MLAAGFAPGSQGQFKQGEGEQEKGGEQLFVLLAMGHFARAPFAGSLNENGVIHAARQITLGSRYNAIRTAVHKSRQMYRWRTNQYTIRSFISSLRFLCNVI